MKTKKIINYILEGKIDSAKNLLEGILYERANYALAKEERFVEEVMTKKIKNKMNNLLFPILEDEKK